MAYSNRSMVNNNHFRSDCRLKSCIMDNTTKLDITSIKSRHLTAEEIWEKHRPHVELLSQVNNSCVFVSELHVGYLYISSNFVDLFGLDITSEDTIEDAGHKLEACIHRDDLLVVINFQSQAFEYLSALSQEEQADYKHIFEFRVLGQSQKYVRIVFQYQILEVREPGEPIILLGVADISPDQDMEAGPKFRLVNFRTGEMIPFRIEESSKMGLTKRELEVLNMAKEGMFSKEISDKLSISIHTVNRHRQNILEKMKVDNVVEAIRHARRWGLLE